MRNFRSHPALLQVPGRLFYHGELQPHADKVMRSTPEYVNTDNRYRLGFLANPKRFNVAITRAKALLISGSNCDFLQLVSIKYLLTFFSENFFVLFSPGTTDIL